MRVGFRKLKTLKQIIKTKLKNKTKTILNIVIKQKLESIIYFLIHIFKKEVINKKLSTLLYFVKLSHFLTQLEEIDGRRVLINSIKRMFKSFSKINKLNSLKTNNKIYPKKILINFADEKFKFSQRFNSETGLKVARFDCFFSYGIEDIGKDFYKKNQTILDFKRGAGYWLWKPYFILKTLEEKADIGDFVFYCDSGSFFINEINFLINEMNKARVDVMCFELPHLEKDWTKRDCFILLDAEDKKYTHSHQILSSFHLIKKSDFSLRFYKEFLQYSQDPRLITDKPNTLGKPNLDGFRDHRHDQSIFSILSKKYDLPLFRDPCQDGNYLIGKPESPKGSYPQIIFHHRNPFS